MADTNHVHGTAPVEGDGVSYSGIVWFVVILTATTIFCQLLVWGAFELMEWRVARTESARAPLAAPPARPGIANGRVVTGGAEPLPAGLLVAEPLPLRDFRQSEAASLSSYGWIDQGAGVTRIPIDRAKALLLERGLPVRPGAPAPAAAPAATPKPAPAPAAPAPAGGAH